MLHLVNIRLIELSDTPLPKVVFVSQNQKAPFKKNNTNSTEIGSAVSIIQINRDHAGFL